MCPVMLPQVSEYLYSPNSPILVTLVHVSVPGTDCGRITLVFYRKRAYKTECVRRRCCGALSIKALEGSRLRLRWTRSMRIQSIWTWKSLQGKELRENLCY